ncbi:hypothetical protein QAD02_006876 [Eretmocerus hayati]|uniref:Uncharacterized protein n=1 Tax=Eretmocerus hayati TaxID=131215 RepID=A0ACC2N225_9HYME|nr:hypothetical protein QAD02_006876 [Eretmocerus hayati]
MNRENQWESVGVLTMSDADSESNFREDTPAKIFGIRTSISNSHRSFADIPKRTYIGLGVLAIVAVIILAFIFASIFGKAPPESSPSTNYLPKGLILADEVNFWSFNFDEENLTKVAGFQKPVGAFDVHAAKSIYWSEKESSKIVSFHTSNLPNDTHENLITIFEDVRTKPKAMAMDDLSGNLYFFDDLYLGKLFVVNVHTRNFSLLIADINNIQEIVVDSNHNLIFMLQNSNVILKANMTGNLLGQLLSPESLNKENHRKISSMALDRTSKRIYWVKDSTTVRSSNYEGNDLKTPVPSSEDILDLTICANHLFRLVHQGPKTQLASCRLFENGTKCINHQRYAIELSNSVRAIGSLPSKEESYLAELHPCNQPNRAGCQQLCFPTSSENYTCGCSIGMQLDLDEVTCRNVSDFILYTWDNLVRGVTIDEARWSEKSLSMMEVFLPTPFTVESTKNKGVIDFDYGLESDRFFYSDDNKIYAMSLRYGGEKQILFQSPNPSLTVEDLAYDWIGDNLYYSLRSLTRNMDQTISVMSLNHGIGSSKTLGTFKYDPLFGMKAAPYAIAVDPGDGSVLFSAGENGRRWIMRYSLNGTHLNQIPEIAFVHEHRLLTLDYEYRLVYWIGSRQHIEYAKYDGSNRTTLRLEGLEPMDEPKTIAVHRNWIYLSNSTSLWRMRNPSGKDAHKIVPADGAIRGKTIAGVRLISSAFHGSSGSNIPGDVRDSCSEPNNLCEQLCFPAPKAAGGPYCDCKDGMKVDRASGKCTAATFG